MLPAFNTQPNTHPAYSMPLFLPFSHCVLGSLSLSPAICSCCLQFLLHKRDSPNHPYMSIYYSLWVVLFWYQCSVVEADRCPTVQNSVGKASAGQHMHRAVIGSHPLQVWEYEICGKRENTVGRKISKMKGKQSETNQKENRWRWQKRI